MALNNCINSATNAGLMSKIRGKKALARFAEIRDALIAGGETPHIAEHLAAQRTVNETAYATRRAKWRKIDSIRRRRALSAAIKASPNPGAAAVKMVDDIDFESRAIYQQAKGRMARFLIKHHADLLGRVKGDPASWRNFLRALEGEQTGDASAHALADAVNDTLEWMRLEMNKNGHNIGKLDNRGVRHSHAADRIGRATYDEWRDSFVQDLDWTKMHDEKTGAPFSGPPSAKRQEEILDAIYNNIVYGRGSRNPKWRAGPEGDGNMDHHRILHFTDTDAWLRYNEKWGATNPFNTILNEISDMSRQVALARRFGHSPSVAGDYMEQLVQTEARNRKLGRIAALKQQGQAKIARGMINVLQGGLAPNGYWGAQSAKFWSTSRQVLTSALLDRAAVISIPSDFNSARLASQAIGMNPTHWLPTYVGMMKDSLSNGGMTRDDLLRQQWIADSFANPSVAMARYQEEFASAEWSQLLSNASMQLGGLASHTDNLKLAWQHGMAGHFASEMKKPMSKLDPRLAADMRAHGLTDADWDRFRTSGGLHTTPNGATFLGPLMWRETTTLPAEEAQELFLKMQSFVERWTERAVPTGSLVAKGVLDPRAYGLTPGSVPYEVMKSGTMFKSFPAAFIVNQVRMVNMRPTGTAKAMYIGEMIGTMTMVGAFAMQVNELLMGRDPQDMTDEAFWWRASLRGGGFGPVGDILFAGTASWGGGIGGYVSGPLPQVTGDAINLTFGNILEVYQGLRSGEGIDTNFAAELAQFGRRYTPMGQTPLLAGGQAMDRLFWDNLQKVLDPESVDALHQADKRRGNLYGNESFWLPATPLPERAPNLRNALGQ